MTMSRVVPGNSTEAESLGSWMAVRWSVFEVDSNRLASWASC
jgi:hypothetical protein